MRFIHSLKRVWYRYREEEGNRKEEIGRRMEGDGGREGRGELPVAADEEKMFLKGAFFV